MLRSAVQNDGRVCAVGEVIVHDAHLPAIPAQVNVLFLLLASGQAARLVSMQREVMNVLRPYAALAVAHPAIANSDVGAVRNQADGMAAMTQEETGVD